MACLFYLREGKKTWTRASSVCPDSWQTDQLHLPHWCFILTGAAAAVGLSGVIPTWNTTRGSSHNHGQTSKVTLPNPLDFTVYCLVLRYAISCENVARLHFSRVLFCYFNAYLRAASRIDWIHAICWLQLIPLNAQPELMVALDAVQLFLSHGFCNLGIIYFTSSRHGSQLLPVHMI